MWLADGDPAITANLWWFLGTTTAALITLIGLLMTSRQRTRPASREEIVAAVDEALDEYRRDVAKTCRPNATTTGPGG